MLQIVIYRCVTVQLQGLQVCTEHSVTGSGCRTNRAERTYWPWFYATVGGFLSDVNIETGDSI
jgi:hypothetical protein